MRTAVLPTVTPSRWTGLSLDRLNRHSPTVAIYCRPRSSSSSASPWSVHPHYRHVQSRRPISTAHNCNVQPRRLTSTAADCNEQSRRSLSSSSTAPPSSNNATWKLKDLSSISRKISPLIVHLTSDNPYHNLSLEHYLLTRSHPDSRILLFYTNRPCVVIGRNQNPWLETDLNRLKEGLVPEQEQEKAAAVTTAAAEEEETVKTKGDASRQMPNLQQQQQQQQQHWTPNALRSRLDNPHLTPVDLVRRRSGGGAVFHDSGNLNYSVIVPNTKSFKRSTHAEMVVRALSSSRFKSQLSSMFPQYGGLELQVNDRNDIVMRHNAAEDQWFKVSGSAYKLTRGRALHHGTLLYSSPYIGRISEILRSPGRDFIHAKGVESVRSKVANLLCTSDIQHCDAVRGYVTDAIIREFWDMYGAGVPRKPGLNEITLGDAECAQDQNPEVAAGVAELGSDAWRFEQTPRFEFDSGVLDGMSVSFQANHGVLEQLSLKDAQGATLVQHRKQDQDFGPEDVKLSDVKSWRELLGSGQAHGQRQSQEDGSTPSKSSKDISVPDALVGRVEATFPRWRT